MSEKVKPEKSDFQYEYNKLGVYIPAPTIRLSKKTFMLRLCVVCQRYKCAVLSVS